MEAQFWRERWELGQTGWHQAEAHPTLVTRWGDLDVPEGATVFVPLCGKSVDMVWLAEQGHRIIGSELSEIAVRDFFAELDLFPTTRAVGHSTVFEAGPYELWCGDFFDLSPEALRGVAAVYDRASLVALPPNLRRAYATHMAALLPPGAAAFVVTYVYDPAEMNGPPFSVSDGEVRELYEGTFDVELLGVDEVSGRNPDLRARGVSAVHEELHGLRRR
jgi:thiopurine S-methyltransferase